jgi:hypothetical protein
MKFETILALITEPKYRKIINDPDLTDYQKAADIHAELEADGEPIGSVRPPRKPRTSKPKPDLENRDARPTQDDGEIG